MLYISPSGNTILTQSSCYTYEEEVYFVYPDRVELCSSKTIGKSKPLSQKYINKVIKKKGFDILVTLDWLGAPIEFLQKNRFKPLDSKEYVENIKSLRKNYKKNKK